MLKIYLAAPLFSEAERMWNKAFAKGLIEAICKKFTVSTKIILPQEIELPHKYGTKEFAVDIYYKCLNHIEESNVIIAILDGSQVDDGTAFEVGYARAMGRSVIGIRSDPRPGEWNGCNTMLSIGCNKIITYKENIDYGLVIDAIVLAARKEL